MDHSKKTIVLSISSDIGTAIAMRRLKQDTLVVGTYRTSAASISNLGNAGARLVEADFLDKNSVDEACKYIGKFADSWSELIVAPGTLEPIGNFESLDFDDWSDSFSINFVNQLRAVNKLLKTRGNDATIIFFAGSGTNGSADRFSAYTASKIALIKMTELLDSEIKDAKFVIIGPGWINTKIHKQTINAKEKANIAYEATMKRIRESDFGSMDDLLDCIDWVNLQPKHVIGGRNISSQHDNWRKNLPQILASDFSAGKLRRHANSRLSSL